jgi:hypothetical protein
VGSKTKRETNRSKKPSKRESQRLESGASPQGDLQVDTHGPEEDQSQVAGRPRIRRERQSNNNAELKAGFAMEKLVLKPPYITTMGKFKFVGNFGHATAFFKKPVVEGSFFVEFVVREDLKQPKKPVYKSAVRVGLCTAAFNTSFPLGYG